MRDIAIAYNIVYNEAHTPLIIEISNKYLSCKRSKSESDSMPILLICQEVYRKQYKILLNKLNLE
jgi:hypothetical protein